MKKQAIIWKKSVYENDFVCPNCGSKLFEKEKPEIMENNLGFPPLIGENDLFCIKCKNHVAHLKEIDTELEAGLHGEWDEEKYGDMYE